MSQEQLRDAAQKALDALEEIALAGMSGTGQESEDGMRDFHARQAWKFIGIAARALDPIRQALATQPDHFPESGKMMKPDLSGFDAFDVLKQGRQARATQPEQAKGGDRVFLVATGEVYEGQETYTRHDIRPPMCDAEVLYTHPAPAAQNEREANATARAFSLATMAAEEFVRCNGLSTGEADEFLMTGADLTDEYATACIEHLKHVGECVAFDCDGGVIVRLGDFTLGSLS